MRSSLTLFGTAIPAASTAVAGLSVAPASGADDSASTSRVARAIAAAKAHPGATRFGSAQGPKAVGTIVDSNGTSNSSKITGIGRNTAQRIWDRAPTDYMTSSTSYKGARTATLNAAKDLYGASSTRYTTVAAAWSAVSVS
jgi:hypothetical protein